MATSDGRSDQVSGDTGITEQHDCAKYDCQMQSFINAAIEDPEPQWPNGLTTLAKRYREMEARLLTVEIDACRRFMEAQGFNWDGIKGGQWTPEVVSGYIEERLRVVEGEARAEALEEAARVFDDMGETTVGTRYVAKRLRAIFSEERVN